METREYRTVDKSSWGAGPWQREPDKRQWMTDAGLPGLIVRGPSGALCGYVGVDESHPWYGKDYSAEIAECADPECVYCQDRDEGGRCWNNTIDTRVTVHGGLTFADRCADTDDESRHICHVPGPGEPDHVWWFGFDCAHLHDVCPAHHALGFPSYKFESEYRGFPSYKFESEYRGFPSYKFESEYRDVDYVTAQVESLARQLVEVSR